MRRLSLALLASISAVALTQIASAADMPVKAPIYKTPVAAPVYNWSGFYVGGNFGGSFGHASTDWTISGAPFGSTSQKMDGVLGGLQAGYNLQSGAFVFGLETDIQATGQKGSSSQTDSTPDIPPIPAIPCIQIDPPAPACIPGTGIPGVPGIPGVHGAATTETKLPWLGTLRARVGLTPSDKWLIYATGGLAYGEIESKGTLTIGATSATVSTNTTKAGWTVGGGFEVALSGRWTGKLEYLYVDFGNVSNTFGFAPFTPIVTDTHVTDNIVRVGVNYRFN